MSSDVAALYERLIERDLDAIPAAVRTFRESHSSDDLFLAVARFAILAYAPSQHAKHAGILGEKGRYAALRIAVWEMTSLGGAPPPPAAIRRDRAAEGGGAPLSERLIENAVAEKGSLEAMHLVFLYEAARDTKIFP